MWNVAQGIRPMRRQPAALGQVEAVDKRLGDKSVSVPWVEKIFLGISPIFDPDAVAAF